MTFISIKEWLGWFIHSKAVTDIYCAGATQTVCIISSRTYTLDLKSCDLSFPVFSLGLFDSLRSSQSNEPCKADVNNVSLCVEDKNSGQFILEFMLYMVYIVIYKSKENHKSFSAPWPIFLLSVRRRNHYFETSPGLQRKASLGVETETGDHTLEWTTTELQQELVRHADQHCVSSVC